MKFCKRPLYQTKIFSTSKILRFLFISIVFSVGFTCKKTGMVKPAPYLTFLDFIARDTSLSMLNSMVQREKFGNLLVSGGPYTFFINTNAGFRKAGITLDSLNKLSDNTVLGILKYGTVVGLVSTQTISKTQLALYGNLIVDTIPNFPVNPFVVRNFYGLFINGIKVDSANIPVAEGIVQRLDGYLYPPTQTLRQIIHDRADLSLLDHIFSRIYRLDAQYNSSTLLFLTFTQPFYQTFCAPNNVALKAYGLGDTAIINSKDTSNLISVLKNQIMSTTVFYDNYIGNYVFGQGLAFPPYTGGYIGNARVTIDYDGTTLIGSQGVFVPKIIQSGIVATNGIINIIDQVNIGSN